MKDGSLMVLEYILLYISLAAFILLGVFSFINGYIVLTLVSFFTIVKFIIILYLFIIDKLDLYIIEKINENQFNS